MRESDEKQKELNDLVNLLICKEYSVDSQRKGQRGAAPGLTDGPRVEGAA